MDLWTNYVDVIYATLLGLSTVFGGNMGLAIGVLSLSLRLAMFPLTVRLARRSLETQAVLKKLEPQLSGLRKKHQNDPAVLWRETEALHRQHGIKTLDGGSVFGSLIQIPLFLGLFAAVQRGLTGTGRFLWVKDLMKSDPLLACLCATVTGVSAFLSPNLPESQRALSIVLPAGLTLLFLWRISAGVAIYSFSSSLIGVAQALWIRRYSPKIRG
jgi:YidC/Oxa1 family membrane protein insertase